MPETLGERIKATREMRHLSQIDLCEVVDLDQSNVSRIEHDQQVPGAETLSQIANALQVTTDYLLNGAITLEHMPTLGPLQTKLLGTCMQALIFNDPDSRDAFLATVEEWRAQL